MYTSLEGHEQNACGSLHMGGTCKQPTHHLFPYYTRIVRVSRTRQLHWFFVFYCFVLNCTQAQHAHMLGSLAELQVAVLSLAYGRPTESEMVLVYGYEEVRARTMRGAFTTAHEGRVFFFICCFLRLTLVPPKLHDMPRGRSHRLA